jgi:hypothetical protein
MKLVYGTKYSLSLEEQSTIQNMSDIICGQGRNFFKDKYQRDKSVKLNEMNLNGFGAELAFCKLCDISFDSSTIENESHFVKVDAILKNGLKVDVKNTVYKKGKLIVRTGKEQKYVDVYALMIGKFPDFVFSGWAAYEEIIQPKLIINLGWGPAYSLNQESLNKELDIQATVS